MKSSIAKHSAKVSGLLAIAAVAALVASAGVAAPRAAPTNTSPPTIDGQAQEGQTLTANSGTWRGTEPITFRIRWLRCNVGGSDCVAIENATRATYKIGADDVGRTIRVEITASNRDGRETARSRPTATIRPAPVNAPANTSAPTIRGTPVEGQTLSGDAGEWSGTQPMDLNFQWQRCDRNGLTCSNISGATSTNYLISKADVDNTIRLRIRAANAAGRTVAFSRPTAVVKSKTPPPPPPPRGPAGAIKLPNGETSIPVTSVAPPQRLVISQARFDPNPLRSRSSPITAQFKIEDTRGFVVRSALVFVIPLPYGWATQPAEVTSEQNGWATVTMRATSKLPRRGAIVMFARARKPGDFVLTGVSTRRLVQMLVSL
jgi:hypothetical protein